MAERIAFMFRRFLDPETKEFNVGGVETYIRHLANLAGELRLDAHVFQPARNAFTAKVGCATVVGLPVSGQDSEAQKRTIFEEILRRVADRDIVVFGADHYSVRTTRPRTLSIQHGIDWDLPASKLQTLPWLLPTFRMRREHDRRVRRVLRYFENCRNTVCVDYNFPNWYRATIGKGIEGNLWVIPNCGSPARPEQLSRPEGGPLRILFARRFETYRGTRVMAAAVASLLNRHTNVLVTFAGEGPDEPYLREQFSGCSRVRFTKYGPGEATGIHLAHDVAVVPSLGSEGTTLAAAEAMGAGCVVVASAIGGLTNMILDGFNGLLIQPSSEDLADALVRLTNDQSFRLELARRGYETAVSSFSIDRWKQKWTSVLQIIAAQG